MGFPIAFLNDPPAPTYPEYQQVVALARQLTPAFVNPADLHPEDPVADRRGDDWCTAVLGRPYTHRVIRITVHEQYLLIAADQLDIDPPLPDWIVQGRAETERYQAATRARKEEQAQFERERWEQARAQVADGIELAVHLGSRPRTRGNFYDRLGHVVPAVTVYTTRNKRTRAHSAGRALCESPTRAKPLGIDDEPTDGVPATCLSCIEYTALVRAERKYGREQA